MSTKVGQYHVDASLQGMMMHHCPVNRSSESICDLFICMWPTCVGREAEDELDLLGRKRNINKRDRARKKGAHNFCPIDYAPVAGWAKRDSVDPLALYHLELFHCICVTHCTNKHAKQC